MRSLPSRKLRRTAAHSSLTSPCARHSALMPQKASARCRLSLQDQPTRSQPRSQRVDSTRKDGRWHESCFVYVNGAGRAADEGALADTETAMGKAEGMEVTIADNAAWDEAMSLFKQGRTGGVQKKTTPSAVLSLHARRQLPPEDENRKSPA